MDLGARLSVIFSRVIHVAAFIPLYCWMILSCINMLYFVYLLIQGWTLGLFPPVRLLRIMLLWTSLYTCHCICLISDLVVEGRICKPKKPKQNKTNRMHVSTGGNGGSIQAWWESTDGVCRETGHPPGVALSSRVASSKGLHFCFLVCKELGPISKVSLQWGRAKNRIQ